MGVHFAELTGGGVKMWIELGTVLLDKKRLET